MNNEEALKVAKADRWEKILLKKTDVDEKVKFDFHLLPLKWVGIVFAISAVFLPFLISIILRYSFNEKEFESLNLGFILFVVKNVIVLLGMIYVIKVLTWKIFLESGASGFYLFYFFPSVVLIIFTIFTENMNQQTKNLMLTIVDVIARMIAIVLIFVFSKSLCLKFKKTLKENFVLIIIVTMVGFASIFALNFIFTVLDNLINGEGVPKNQEGIKDMKSTTTGMVCMFFLTVFVAPFIEELATRHSVFSLTGNKWLGFFTSLIYFSGMHVDSNGDWNRILPYMAGSLVLSLTFLYVRGNVTYTIFLHMLFNTFAFLMLFIERPF